MPCQPGFLPRFRESVYAEDTRILLIYESFDSPASKLKTRCMARTYLMQVKNSKADLKRFIGCSNTFITIAPILYDLLSFLFIYKNKFKEIFSL
jgi:hypothetical protein